MEVSLAKTIGALAVVSVVIAISAYSQVYQNFTIRNRAVVKSVGVDIFWDYNCTQPVDFIDWGVIEPSETKTVILYVNSSSNVNVTLSGRTENWNPVNASQYITLSANYTGYPLLPNTVTPIELYLTVSPDITEIREFTFDIIIYVEG